MPKGMTMLEHCSEEQITQALKDMDVQMNNNMRQEFVEGLRNGRPANYFSLRNFLHILQNQVEGLKIPDHITEQQITETLQDIGWIRISKMRDEIYAGVLDGNPNGYENLHKFFSCLEKKLK